MPEFLLELFSEEIPARMQARAAEDLLRAFTGKLQAVGLEHGPAQALVTPRRLVLVVPDLPTKQPDVVEEKKGPKVGAPEKALEGFMKANGLSDISEASQRETPKGVFYFLERTISGRATADVLPQLIEDTLRAFPWPKSMRWGRNKFRWVRPLHSILALFDGETVAGQLDLGARTLVFGNSTTGHRFLSPDSFTVRDFADYKVRLAAAKVIVDPQERRQTILEAAEGAAKKAGLSLKPDLGLLEEVTGLVEWPVVLMGRIDPAFMGLPPEVLSTSMRAHQKYFSLLNQDGSLADRFLFVANMETDDQGARIIAGNERVLAARLADAAFFWEQDRGAKLETRVAALGEMVFHAKLGSQAEKVQRIEDLAGRLSGLIEGCDAALAKRAAYLAKADLVTEMVGEFPELQGIMGRYYALADGEEAAVAQAIADHYAPQGPNDRCPDAPLSSAVALADKLDSLMGFWSIDEKPTGSKDPFALRRAALGVIRLILENKLRLPLSEVLDSLTAEQREDLLSFFADRLKVALRDQGVRHDLITAVFALGGEDDLVRLLARVDALAGFIESEDGENLKIAHGRAANIVRIEAKKEGGAIDGAVDPALLVEPEEKALQAALERARQEAGRALENEDFSAAMAAMAALRGPVDDFFDQVTVNTDEAEVRINRLRLLAAIDATLRQVADFSRIEG